MTGPFPPHRTSNRSCFMHHRSGARNRHRAPRTREGGKRVRRQQLEGALWTLLRRLLSAYAARQRQQEAPDILRMYVLLVGVFRMLSPTALWPFPRGSIARRTNCTSPPHFSMLPPIYQTLCRMTHMPCNVSGVARCWNYEENACLCMQIQNAVVECPDGMVYQPLEVTQGVPPFGGVNGLDDFIAAGCDSTNSTCVVRILQLDRRRPCATCYVCVVCAVLSFFGQKSLRTLPLNWVTHSVGSNSLYLIAVTSTIPVYFLVSPCA